MAQDSPIKVRNTLEVATPIYHVGFCGCDGKEKAGWTEKCGSLQDRKLAEELLCYQERKRAQTKKAEYERRLQL